MPPARPDRYAAQDERDELVARGRDADRGGLVLILADAQQSGAELGSADRDHERHREHQQCQRAEVVRPELRTRGSTRRNGMTSPWLPLVMVGQVHREHLEQLERGERDHDVGVPAGAPGGESEASGQQRRGDRRGRDPRPPRHAELDDEDRRRVRADAEEGAVAERDVAGESAHHVPGRGHDGQQHDQDEHVLDVEVAPGEWADGEEHDDERGADDGDPVAAGRGVRRRGAVAMLMRGSRPFDRDDRGCRSGGR